VNADRYAPKPVEETLDLCSERRNAAASVGCSLTPPTVTPDSVEAPFCRVA